MRLVDHHGPALLGGAASVVVAVAAAALTLIAEPSGPRDLVVGGGVPAEVPVAVAPVAQALTAVPGQVRPTTPQQGYAGWAAQFAGPTGVPARALQAYAAADARIRVEQPSCGLSWVTLAGIGRIESDHGRYGGRTLLADGTPSTPIIGIALDGSRGVAQIADTDRGVLDGDTRWDRAVGPMQFIPATWARWGADGDGDGRADPQNLDDAALAAARYLCASGDDLAQGRGWWDAVLSYNKSAQYATDVLANAKAYAARSRG